MAEEKSADEIIKKMPKIILGTMEFGRRLNEKDSHEIMTSFLKPNEKSNKVAELDTAFMYQGGKTETIMGKINKSVLSPNNALIATKAMPKAKDGLTDKGIRNQLQVSLSRLQCKSVDIFYLHWPDHNVKIEESLKTMNDLYKEGKFKRFGLSNYSSWQVAEIYYLCKANGYVLPTVYQGMYNCITRGVEAELFPCLRRFGIIFYAYNPLAGGVLSGKHKYEQKEKNEIDKGGRFDGDSPWAKAYKNRFWNKSMFDGVDLIKSALKKAYGVNDDGSLKVSMVNASLRWLMRHSKMNENDGCIMGPSTLKYYNENLAALEDANDLDESVVKAIDEAWELSKVDLPNYYR